MTVEDNVNSRVKNQILYNIRTKIYNNTRSDVRNLISTDIVFNPSLSIATQISNTVRDQIQWCQKQKH